MKQNASENLQQIQREMEATIAEIVTTIENFFAVAPFTFMEGHHAEPGEYIFPDNWEAWSDTLFPKSPERQHNVADPDFGFFLGVLVGAKLMGANRTQLVEKSRGLIVQRMGYLAWREAANGTRKEDAQP